MPIYDNEENILRDFRKNIGEGCCYILPEFMSKESFDTVKKY